MKLLVETRVPLSIEQIESFLALGWKAQRTNNLEKTRHHEFSHQFGDEYQQKGVQKAISSSGLLVAHHAKFELQWLLRCGYDTVNLLVWDTLLGEYVLAGNRRWDLSLDATAKRYGLGGKVSLVKQLIESGVCPSDIPESWLLGYCSQDTLLCHSIFLKQRERIVEAGLLSVMYTRCLLTPVLADIEMRGIQLDPNRVKEEYETTSRLLGSIRERLSRFSGGINWRSSQQVAGFVYDTLKFDELRRGSKLDRTDGGKPRTDSETIENLRTSTAGQREFISCFKEFKRLEKRLQNLEKLKACCELDDGRLYAQYNQAVAATQRLTSSGLRHKVQFQNIDHTLKRLFTSRNKGWKIGEADKQQVEFRVAAHLGQDPAALADIRDPSFDVHWQTAEQLYQKPRTALSKEVHRYESKPRTFRPLYGGEAGDAAFRRYIKFFREKYSGIYKTQESWAYTVLKDKQLRTQTGLIFYWPDCVLEETRDGRGYIRHRTAIFNYPVQCTDGATEYFDGVVWAPIKDYKGGVVTQFNQETHEVSLAQPLKYIKNAPIPMLHFKKQGIDMMLTGNHRVLLQHKDGQSKDRICGRLGCSNS